MSDEEPAEQPEERPGEDPEAPPIQNNVRPTSTGNRGPSVQNSNEAYQPGQHKKNLSSLSACCKIIIATTVAIFVLILFVMVALLVNGKIKVEIDQFRKDFEEKNDYFRGLLDNKISEAKVDKELKTLKELIDAEHQKAAVAAGGIPVPQKKIDSIDKNCMLQSNVEKHDKEQDYCCQLLAQSVKEVKSWQAFEYCLALLLKVRYSTDVSEENRKSQTNWGRLIPGTEMPQQDYYSLCPIGRWHEDRWYYCCTHLHCIGFKHSYQKAVCEACHYRKLPVYPYNGCPSACYKG